MAFTGKSPSIKSSPMGYYHAWLNDRFALESTEELAELKRSSDPALKQINEKTLLLAVISIDDSGKFLCSHNLISSKSRLT